jgi:hypothetical protein
MAENEYEDTFNCSICGLEKVYHEDILEKSDIIICDDCNIEGIFQESCSKCDREFSDIEFEFLINKFNKVIDCVQCLSMDEDKKLELSFYKFKYLNKKTTPNKEEKNDFKYKYEQLTRNVNNLLEISNSKNIDEFINTFSELKEEHRQFVQIIEDNNEELTCPEDISRIIKEKNKYKSKYKYILNLLKENDILEYDKFLNFVKNYKNLETFNNINENSIKHDPHHQDDEYFIEYKHKVYDYKLKKLLEKNKKIKEDTPKIEKLKNININEINSLHINISNSYINILDELDILEKEANEIERVLPIFNKLKNNINFIDTIEEDDNELSKLFSKLNKDKINEYTTMSNIGEKIIEKNLQDDYVNNHIKFFNDRKGRIILKCKRIYLLSKHINIEAIALSGISHFIRDSHINTFNCLLDLLKTHISHDLMI